MSNVANNSKKIRINYFATIGKYYNENQFLYNLVSPKTKEIHYGFWYKNTKTDSEAIRNTTKCVAELLKLKKTDKVLDAGCGIGGPAIYMAEKYGCQVTGITVSKKQLALAIQNVKKSHAVKLLNFLMADYTNTGFRSGSFSKIFGIESVCYAFKKPDFLKEAYRLTRSGGKLVVCDAFLIKSKMSSDQKSIYIKFTRGWAVPNLTTIEDFSKMLKQAGFKKIRFYDKTKLININIFMVSILFPLGIFISKVLCGLRILPKSVPGTLESGILMEKIITEKIAKYGVFVAEK